MHERGEEPGDMHLVSVTHRHYCTGGGREEGREGGGEGGRGEGGGGREEGREEGREGGREEVEGAKKSEWIHLLDMKSCDMRSWNTITDLCTTYEKSPV